MNRKWKSLIGISVVVAAALAAVWNITAGSVGKVTPTSQGAAAPSASSEPAVRVEVASPERRTLTRTVRMPATLDAFEEAELYAKTSGYVASVLVDIGSPVKPGQVLLTIDVPEMADELAQAEAERQAMEALVARNQAKLETARAEVNRFQAEYDMRKLTRDRKKELCEQHAIPQQELDEAEAELAVAVAKAQIARAAVAGGEADLRAAQAAVSMTAAKVARIRTLMEYATLRAPFDGVITERFVHPGAFVRSAADGATTPLLSIARTDKLRLALEIPESDASFVRVGTGVEITLRAIRNQAMQAEITRVAGALRPQTRTLPVEVDLINNDGDLAPGMYAQVTVLLETKARALLIPSKSIRVRGTDLSVLVANDRVARAVPVTIGYDDGIWAEVLSGLKGDELIITSATSVVAPGAPVVPVGGQAGAG